MFCCSHVTARRILLDAGVSIDRRYKQRKLDLSELRRLYVDERKPISAIVTLMNVGPGAISNALKAIGVTVLRGGQRQILFPELRKLEVGQSLELPRIEAPDRRGYVRYYLMAKKAGIRVSIKRINGETVRVTRKA